MWKWQALAATVGATTSTCARARLDWLWSIRVARLSELVQKATHTGNKTPVGLLTAVIHGRVHGRAECTPTRVVHTTDGAVFTVYKFS